MRILHLIPYSRLFPPGNGGQLRCFHLLQELAGEHEVHAVILQPEAELRQPRNGYEFPASVRVYGPAQTPPPLTFFNQLPLKLARAFQYRWLRRSWRGPANSDLLETHHLIRQILRDQPIDIVIFEHLASMMASPLVRGLAPKAVQVLDAHNIDHKLIEADEDKGARKSTLWHETHLKRSVDAFFACSEEDQAELEALNQHQVRGFTIPNGVDTAQKAYDDRADKHSSKDILFCGSLNYPPNREGLLWFHKEVWPLVLGARRDVRLTVIGRGAMAEDFPALRTDSSVSFVGEVETVKPFYHQAGLAIVPLHSGSGTRLKILEAMSFGNPVVSTGIGAEGIKAKNGEHLLLADDPHEFAQAVLRLFSEPELFNRIRRSARALVEEQYDWRVIGRQINAAIQTLVQKHRR